MDPAKVSRSNVVGVTAAGGVLYRERAGAMQVLLIYRNEIWDLPKGKQEPGENIASCAQREVSEEVGCPTPAITMKIGTTYHEYERNGNRYGKTTHWYAMKTDRDSSLEPEQEEGITKVSWVTLEDAIQKAGYENLSDILRQFKRKVAG